MTPRFYQLLLRLLSRRRRERFGADMADTFRRLQRETRRESGVVGLAVLWLRETAGLVRFALRPDRPRAPRPAWKPALELKLAWKGLRARRSRALIVVALLGVALGTTAAMFSVADSLLFNRRPYPHTERIFALQAEIEASSEQEGRHLQAQLLDAWRAQGDMVEAVGASMQKTVFVERNGTLQKFDALDITPGLLEVLGVRPKWGRLPVPSDTTDDGVFAAVLGERLAVELFGSAARAVGQRLEATGRPLVVVGVMDRGFAFPSPRYQVWRVFDPAGPLAYMHGISPLLRLRPGTSVERAPELIAERSTAVGRAVGLPKYTATIKAQFSSVTPAERRRLLFVLLGAALCLLAAACASATNLELANATYRARTRATHVALGASTGSVARTAALEGLALAAAAGVTAIGVAWAAIHVSTAWLPQSLALSTQNPINVDGRTVASILLAALAAWLLTSLLPILAASRSSVLPLLKSEDRSSAASARTTHLRRVLTIAEVALAVMLVIGGLLYVRSYQRLLAVDKGFDSSGIVDVGMALPATFFEAGEDRGSFTARLAQHVLAQPGVKAVTSSSAPPSVGDSPMQIGLEIDGQPAANPVQLGRLWIDDTYFSVVGLPLKRGRFANPTDPATNVVVSESFAHRFWPDGDAVGHTFRAAGNSGFGPNVFSVIGVVGDFRTAPTRMPEASDKRFHLYTFIRPQRQPQAPSQKLAFDAGSYWTMAHLTVRLESTDRTGDLVRSIRRFDPRLQTEIRLADDVYADMNVETRLASQVVGAFAIVAVLVALAGVYAVMAYLVASRRREIGVRVALGATPRDVRNLVFGSSARLVLIGAGLGALGAAAGGFWMESQLFGVSATDPGVYAGAVIGVVAATMMSTWLPAMQAAQVNPTESLRGD